MPNEGKASQVKVFDLETRTSQFGEAVIRFVKTLPETSINKPLISQLIRSGTSIGANYMEADTAESKKDFIHKMGICKKEAKETIHWIGMMTCSNPDKKEGLDILCREVYELLLIFSAIINKTRSRMIA